MSNYFLEKKMLHCRDLRVELSNAYDSNTKIYNISIVVDEPSKLIIEVVNLSTIKIARFEVVIADLDAVTNEDVLLSLLSRTSEVERHLKSEDNVIVKTLLIEA